MTEPCGYGHNGQCCCHCRYQVEFVASAFPEAFAPWHWACVVFVAVGSDRVVLRSEQHGCCEAWEVTP